MKIIKKINKLLLVIIALTLCVFAFQPTTKPVVNAANTYESKTQELRAVWVSHFAGDVHAYQDEASYKEEILGILNNMEAMGFNTIIFHIRTHNNALYKSELNPLASFWSKVNFDEFDPLEWMIEECHSRGIEFHAWLNPYRISTNGTTSHYVSGAVPEGNPVLDEDNLLVSGNSIILDPGIPEVRDYIVESCMEVIENYDVDAIHFDDYFYISGCDDTETRNKYNTKGLSLGNFRREQVDLFIEQLSDSMYKYNIENNKTVQLGISPSGIYRNGSYGSNTVPEYDENGNLTYPLYSNTSGFAHYDDYLYSDTKKWIDEEWIDYILPQTYWAIGHTSASFSKLTKWWSWAVENKKTNLYIAVGVYMALESGTSGSYWKGAEEVKNQLIDANQYDKIAGISFYKYSSLLSSNSLITGHVKDLKNMWVKALPGSVQQRYTHLPEIDVQNIINDGSTLSWDKAENVRGYMVWKVEKNREVDTTNLDHLYIYTQDTSVEIEDGYDYYVSTVNLANEISEPLSGKAGGNVERVINLINGIALPVSLDQEDKINNIKVKYDALTAEEKALVTNVQILEFALNQIESLKSFETDAKAFANTLETDTTYKYVLPLSYLDYAVTWQYVNSADSKLYNIETGEVLVEYLATTIVKLQYTLTKNGVSYTGIHNLNIGYVKQSEIGLIYRNTPNSLNKEEDSSANVSFIGWSGKAFKFDNYVFFIAAKNYHELTSTTIPKGDWSSCGNVYVNKTNKTITDKVSSFSITTISNYGYLIIGADGLVRLTVATANSSDTISLAPGEILYSSNYLDGLINNSPLRPATGIAVGTKMELITPEWKQEVTEDDKVKELVEEINNLPSTITLLHQTLIERLESNYNALTDSAKTKVTNYSKLVSARNTLNNLIEAETQLNQAKLEAIHDIKVYIGDLSIYSESGKTQIANIIAMYEINVNNATDILALDQIVLDAKQSLDNVLTQAEEDAEIINEEREKAIKTLNETITDLSIYSENGKAIIETILAQAINKINAATTVEEVLSIVQLGIESLQNVSTQVEEYQQMGINSVNNLVEGIDYSLYSSTNANMIRQAILKTKTSILNSTEKEVIDNLVNELDQYIKSVKTKEQELKELEDAKTDAINVIENSYNIDDYTEENKAVILAIVEEYIGLINNATTATKIVNYKAEALSKISAVEIDVLGILRRETISSAKEYIDGLKTSEVGKNQLDTLYNEFVTNIENEENAGKIKLLLNQFKVKADLIVEDNPEVSEPDEPEKPVDPEVPEEPKKESNCSLTGAYVSSFLFIALAGCLLIIKKRN